jgi:hypothetical protein
MGMSSAERSARYRAKDVEAYRERKAALAREPEHREKRKLYQRKWREKNRERHNELARESHQRNKHKHVEQARARHLKYTYGITEADYEAMLSRQGGACHICKTTDTGKWKYLHVDHDHVTGKVRGLLCVRCNTKLEWYEVHHTQIEQYLKETGK